MKLDIPEIKLKDPHWKVGDNMGFGPTDPKAFGIGQIAIVQIGERDENAQKYEIVFYDKLGKSRG